MHYYQFNIGDYASHTRHLSPIEDIAYRRLLDVAYTTERPLSKDIRVLTRLINLREYHQETQDVLTEFFIEVDDGWINNRVIKEIKKTGKKSESAKNSAAIRWDRERKAKELQSQCGRNANALNNNANECKNDATHNTLPITHNTLPITQDEKREKDKDCKKPQSSRPTFSPPTIEELKSYAMEKSLPDEAEKFVNFYESNGWKVGKNKMASWKAAFSGWCSRQDQFTKPRKEDTGYGNGTISAEVWNSLDF